MTETAAEAVMFLSNGVPLLTTLGTFCSPSPAPHPQPHIPALQLYSVVLNDQHHLKKHHL